ncbi:hypothetical protein LWM68_15820 [Niabella sp. W65]|nr:hypothetical protein [Niabella sp. W65]MCH7364094.1 hypothetical protein [Niabella sp. W65]ULT39971.1 hypothetical protein KRR40_34645 [Niabella sp. I65]
MSKFKINFKSRFWSSGGEILALLAFTFLPLGLNILIAFIPALDKSVAIESKIVPGEMLAYCLSLIAPLFLFLLKTHGKSFGVPALKPMFIIAFGVYLLAIVLTLIAKNGLISGIDFNGGHHDSYFWISIIALLIAMVLRFYTEFQNSRFSDYRTNLERQQEELNNSFRNSIS